MSNIKLPFTVDFFFFLYTCKDFGNDGEVLKANGLQVDIYTISNQMYRRHRENYLTLL